MLVDFAYVFAQVVVLAMRERNLNETLALATQRPENVTFYQSFGFETVSEDIVGNGEASLRNWIMISTPAS